ncbi:MAG: hypothetical protein ACI9LM_005026 [Alteromonadaceae bacterium]|jgi:hypothetical protein
MIVVVKSISLAPLGSKFISSVGMSTATMSLQPS